MTFEEMEQALRQRLLALPPAPRAELIHVLMLPDPLEAGITPRIRARQEVPRTRLSAGPLQPSSTGLDRLRAES